MALMSRRDAVLGGLGKQFVGQFTEPSFEHGADDVDVVEIVLLKEIDITLYSALAKEYVS